MPIFDPVATHQLHVIPQTDYIYFLQEGRIAEQGTYAELIEQGKDFAKLIEEFGNADESSDSEEFDEMKGDKLSKVALSGDPKKGATLIQQEVSPADSRRFVTYTQTPRNEQKVT